MQKTMICLGLPIDGRPAEIEGWHDQLRDVVSSYSDAFSACSFNIPDQHVAPAHLLAMKNTEHPKDAVISVWSDNAFQLDGFIAELSKLATLQAYGVIESEPIRRESSTGRVEGMCQIAFIKKPQAMDRPTWLNLWLGNHTQVAIDTQSTFGYRQNVVAIPLPLVSSPTQAWPLMDAIVEENFPAIAMTSREAFFAAEGDPERFEAHQQIMMESCFKFIDFEAFDCVPMSEYIIKAS